jgi:hypothetical protein
MILSRCGALVSFQRPAGNRRNRASKDWSRYEPFHWETRPVVFIRPGSFRYQPESATGVSHSSRKWMRWMFEYES